MRKKIIAAILVLICVVSCFSIESFAIEFFGESIAIYDNKTDSSGTVGELNIVPMHAILQGEEIQMTVKELSVSAMSNVAEWSSSNPKIISCTKAGKIKGLLQGKATITVRSKNGGASDTFTVYCAEKLNSVVSEKIKIPVAFTGFIPSFFSFQCMHFNINNIFSSGKLNVEGVYGSFFYVTFKRNDNKYKGFILQSWMPNDVASDEIFRQLSVDEIVVFSGESSTKKLTTNYDGTVKWSVFDESIVSFDKSTGKVTAKKPGVTTITATVGTKTLSCMIFSVSRWNDPEISTTTKEIEVRNIPANKGKTVATLPKGTSMTADGDLENGFGWIHITSGDISGFIKVSDFPGIDYLMTEYHYYDEGFDVRYASAQSKIESYTYTLNKIMMDNFNLKVCSYVEPYTSTADQCKIWKYGSVSSDNLYTACPKTGYHNSGSCLLRSTMLRDMTNKNGYGTKVIARCLWTGHILENHEITGASAKENVIIFTTRNSTYGVGNQILDLSSTEIRNARLYEIVHETGHLLGTVDGYCNGVSNDESHCSNTNCYDCNGQTVPKCIMVQDFNPENAEVVFCDECKSIIKDHLKNHH